MTLEKDNAEGGDDSDLKVEDEEETNRDDSCSRKRGRAKRENLQPVVKLARIVNTGQKAVSSPSTAFTNTGPETVNAVGSNNEEDSGTDTEDEGWEEPNFKDEDWFNRESRRCQTCKKSYSKPFDASLCITTHKSLRCYFCFKVYTTTEILFKHFRRRHDQGGNENTLICPFCDDAVLYKSVSSHVISVHLRKKSDAPASTSTATGRSSKPSTDNGRHLSRLPSRSVSTGTGTKEDSGTDTEDEGWEKPNFKDKDWFIRESRRCQTCNKSYSKPADASLCITSHKSLRCYFCFKVYTTTEILFKHFRRRHEQGKRENTLTCPFCNQIIPYKSVSCHVISVHLRPKRATTASPSTATGRSCNGHLSRPPSRSVSTNRSGRSSSQRNPPKRARNASTPPAPPPQKKKKGKQNRKCK